MNDLRTIPRTSPRWRIAAAFHNFESLINGMPTAIALLVIVLLTQNVLQTAINARVMGDSLNLHPLVILVVTMMGGIFAGILGAALAAPLAALVINAGRRLSKAYRAGAEEAG